MGYAYVESLLNERGTTAAAFLERAIRHFRRHDVRIERVLTDKGSCYRSRDFRDVAAAYAIRLKRTRTYRPQTKGKAEAFNKILQNEWAYLALTPPTSSAWTRCHPSSRTTIVTDHTAASAELLSPHACKQRPWEHT